MQRHRYYEVSGLAPRSRLCYDWLLVFTVGSLRAVVGSFWKFTVTPNFISNVDDEVQA